MRNFFKCFASDIFYCLNSISRCGALKRAQNHLVLDLVTKHFLLKLFTLVIVPFPKVIRKRLGFCKIPRVAFQVLDRTIALTFINKHMCLKDLFVCDLEPKIRLLLGIKGKERSYFASKGFKWVEHTTGKNARLKLLLLTLILSGALR